MAAELAAARELADRHGAKFKSPQYGALCLPRALQFCLDHEDWTKDAAAGRSVRRP